MSVKLPTSRRAPATTQDTFVSNPYIHFIISEAWAGVTGVAVYALFRIGAYGTQSITGMTPLQDPAPALFLETILSWGAAISAASTFAIISTYQFAVLIKRLWGALQ